MSKRCGKPSGRKRRSSPETNKKGPLWPPLTDLADGEGLGFGVLRLGVELLTSVTSPRLPHQSLADHFEHVNWPGVPRNRKVDYLDVENYDLYIMLPPEKDCGQDSTFFASKMSLSGKIAIVTGGARGIGAGIVRTLAAQGASVSHHRDSILTIC